MTRTRKPDPVVGSRSGPSLTVWVYDSTFGAAAGQVRLNDLVRRGAVRTVEAVTMTWVPGSHQPHLGHLRKRSTAAEGSVLGALVTALVALDANDEHRLRTLARRLAGTGLDQEHLAGVHDAMAPGTSALLVLASDVDLDAVRPVVERAQARDDIVMVHADLATDALDALQRALLPKIG